VPIIGTSPDSIDLAEDRERFRHVIDQLGWRQTPSDSATNHDQGRRIRRADRLSGGRPPELRAGRPGDGNRLRRAEPGPLHGRSGRRQP